MYANSQAQHTKNTKQHHEHTESGSADALGFKPVRVCAPLRPCVSKLAKKRALKSVAVHRVQREYICVTSYNTYTAT